MEFKDVWHLYIGCKAKDTFNDVILDWNIKTAHMYIQADSIDQVKPILRPLSDMTDDEKIVVGRTITDAPDRNPIFAKENTDAWAIRKGMRPVMSCEQSTQVTVYLLSCHFDLFDLIASGQAIDATTLTPNPYQNV